MTLKTFTIPVFAHKDVVKPPLQVPQSLKTLFDTETVLALGVNQQHTKTDQGPNPLNGGLSAIVKNGDKQTTVCNRQQAWRFFKDERADQIALALFDALTENDLLVHLAALCELRTQNDDTAFHGPSVIYTTTWLFPDGSVILCDDDIENNVLPETDVGGVLVEAILYQEDDTIKDMQDNTTTQGHVNGLCTLVLPPNIPTDTAHDKMQAQKWLKNHWLVQVPSTLDGVQHFNALFELIERNVVVLPKPNEM